MSGWCDAMLDPLQYGLGALSGILVGFSLALVGGGGSILAVPLMVYLVGITNPHMAIGTSALAVAANAALGLANHARAHHVKWRIGFAFAAPEDSIMTLVRRADMALYEAKRGGRNGVFFAPHATSHLSDVLAFVSAH